MSMLLEKLRPIIADVLHVDPNKITAKSHLVNDLGAESLNLVELTMRLEEAFNFEIPDADAARLRSVPDVMRYIEKHAPKGWGSAFDTQF